MIKKLRIRLILLVILALGLISAGIVVAINAVNQQNIDQNAYESLRILMQNEGWRPSLRRDQRFPGETASPDVTADTDAAAKEHDLSTPAPLPQQEGWENRTLPPWMQEGDERGFLQDRSQQHFRGFNREIHVELSNYYTVMLDDNGGITGWISDRTDLYDETEIRETVSAALQTGLPQGKLSSQYFITGNSPDGTRMMVVLDARLEQESARQVLRITIMVALCAWVILSVGAFFLIRRMTRPVEEAFEKQKQFVWDASHELKTPMAVISAHAELLRKEHGDSESISYILSEVSRADQLVKNLLSLARLDKGSALQPMAEFDLSAALLSVILPFESTVFENGKTLETDIPDNIRMVGQEDMIQQLMVILLSNALKYSDDGGLIRVTLAQKNSKRVLTVFNTGDGIAPENREKVFDRFYREDLSHNSAIEGSGLGLAIARAIVEMHKGQITAGGEWHKNAVFTVVF